MSGAETARRRVVQRRIGGAESAAPKWWRRNGPPPLFRVRLWHIGWKGHLEKDYIEGSLNEDKLY